ncbi:MAG: efflux RND transporter periplasmic adaptor subunit [Ignavibacteria bacterium]
MNTKNKKVLITISSIILIAVIVFGSYELFFKKTEENVTGKTLYTCPMHPQIISDHPGQCPICGMDLIIKTNNDGNEKNENPGKVDLTGVKLSPSEQVLANVQTVKVMNKVFSGEKTFNGYVKINEKNFGHLASPVSGRIDKMYVNFEGQYVRKGDPIFEIYSPELVSSQKEYLLALDNYHRVSEGNQSFATGQAESLLKSSRERLSNWEFTQKQFEDIERTKQPVNTITIHARYSGYITKKYVHVGHWAAAGEDIYDVADLSTVWVIANVYESDVRLIKQGQGVEIISAAYPDKPLMAKVNYIDPVFNPDSRTLEVRIDVNNSGDFLKPDMYVKIKINTYAGENLAVPKNAVLRTGEKNYVYVEKEKGVYVPRNVDIGYEQDGYYSVTSGLKEGETVVSQGGFLIDSETQIEQSFMSEQKTNKNSDDKPKINPDQDIMKDMEMKNKK